MRRTRRNIAVDGPLLSREVSAAAGRNIAILRRRKGLGQRELGVLAGWSAPIICRIESGERLLGELEAGRFAELLGVSPEALLSGCANCGGDPPAWYTCQACGADRPAGTAGGS